MKFREINLEWSKKNYALLKKREVFDSQITSMFSVGLKNHWVPILCWGGGVRNLWHSRAKPRHNLRLLLSFAVQNTILEPWPEDEVSIGSVQHWRGDTALRGECFGGLEWLKKCFFNVKSVQSFLQNQCSESWRKRAKRHEVQAQVLTGI